MNRRMMGARLAGGLSAAAALVALAPRVPSAFADGDWCDSDPLIQITTPTGLVLPVHVTTYALGQHQGALLVVHDNPRPPYITYTVDPINKQGGKKGPSNPQTWDVVISILIPATAIAGDAVEPRGNAFQTRAVASTGLNGTGTVLATTRGRAGDLMTLKFTIVD